MNRVVDWALRTEASTRTCALLRIGLPLLLWTRYGEQLILFQKQTVTGIAFSLAFWVATTLMLVGAWTRVSSMATGIIALSMYYYFGQYLGREEWTHHHTYLLAMATFLCALTPCGRSYSVDRWRAVEPPPERGNIWGLRLIALQVAAVYFYSAYNKTTWGFLSGDRMEHHFMDLYVGSNLPDGTLFVGAMMVLSITTVLLEYALAFGLFVPRLVKYLIPAGILFHAIIYITLPVATFSATMFLLYLAFLDPDAVHRWLDR